MSLDGLKQYQVQYTITLKDEASAGLTALVEAAQKVQAPLTEAATSVNKITSQMNAAKVQLGKEWHIAPLIDKEKAMQGLKELEALVTASSNAISAQMSKALSGAKGKMGDIYDSKTNKELVKWYNEARTKLAGVKEGKNNIKLISEEEQAKQRAFIKGIEKTFEARGTTYTKEAKKLSQTVAAAEKTKVKASATSDALAPYQSLAKDSKRLSSVANSIKKIHENINAYVPKTSRKIILDADISPATRKINTLLATIRESTAALPVTIVDASKAMKKAGKSISAATGQATKAGLESAKLAAAEKPAASMDKILAGQKQPESAKKTKSTTTKAKSTISSSVEQMTALANKMEALAKGKTIDLKATFSDGGVVAKFSEAIAKIQELANTKPLTLKLRLFNNGDEVFQVNQIITKLQNLINEKPLTLKLKLSELGIAGIEETIVKAQELANSKPITLKTKLSNVGNVNAGKAAAKAQESIKKGEISLKVKLNNVASANIKKVIDLTQAIANEKPITIKTTISNISVTSISKTITAARKVANEHVINVKAKLNDISTAGFTKGLTSIQKLADKNAIALKLKFANSNALSAGLKSIISQLQHIARENPIVVQTSGEMVAKKGAVTSNKGTNTTSVVKSAEASKNAVNNAYYRHQEQMNNMRTQLLADQAKFERKMNKMRLAARQADLEAAFKSPDALIYGEKPNGASATNITPIPTSARTAKQPSLFSRAKTRFYGLTGNSSFGATTPMAVDMAKGMGTMFAIGGAMSAIGSSLHQSINYQNIMKTTEAILKNGTDNYSEQGFKEMEQVVRTVGKETKFTAPQVASAAKFLAMAGYDIPAVKSAITPVANLALIGDTNLGETADKMTNVMTTFGIKPDQMSDIADIMTSTFTRSNVDMMMLAESAKYAGGIAQMYGGNFKNNFSDTMAMFGILGNSGIQASSAGTTIRMMYQNLMKPNKNATATMKKYGIVNRDKDGNPLEIVSIIKQLFEKVPANKIADAVGDIFRITAQPGASTLIKAIKEGTLEKLISANRAAAGTGVAQSIADEKKNTLSGLWAQVESTFTEGILQAVEGREGGWAGMLMKLRDYLAKPETIQMLSGLVDLVEHLLGYMATFARIWTKLYATFPGLINGWMQLQLVLTQIGMLIRPIISLGTALESLGFTFGGSAAAGAAGAMSAAGAAKTATYMATLKATRFSNRSNPISKKAKGLYKRYLDDIILFGGATAVGEGKKNIQLSKTVYHNSLWRLRRAKQLKNYALLERYMAIRAASSTFTNKKTPTYFGVLGGLDNINAMRRKNAKIAAIRHANRAVSPAVLARYTTMYANKSPFKTSFISGISAGANAMTLTGVGASLKGMLVSVVGGLGKALGALTSPLGLAAAGVAGFGALIWKCVSDVKTHEANLKLAVENSKWGEIANSNIQKSYMETGINAGGFKPVQIGYDKKAEPPADGYKISNSVADILIDSDKLDNLVASEIANNYAFKFKYLPQELKDKFTKETPDYLKYYYTPSSMSGQLVEGTAVNRPGIEQAKKLSMIALWGEEASKAPELIKAMEDLQKATLNHDDKQIKDILDAYKPTSRARMMDMTDASAIKDIQDPTKYYEWQKMQYDILQNIVSPLQHYADAMGMLEAYKNMTKDELKNYDVSQFGQAIIQAVPIAFNGTTASITLDKMGNIDWMELSKSVNNNIPFTVEQQQEILQNVYDAIYNDPNIQQCSSMLSLLAKYLPEIANNESPYGGGWGVYWDGSYTLDGNSNSHGSYENSDGSSLLLKKGNKPDDTIKTLAGHYLNLSPFAAAPMFTTEFGHMAANTGVVQATIDFQQKYPERFKNQPQFKSTPPKASVLPSVTGGTLKGTTPKPRKNKKNGQHDYENKYGRNAARPTQVIINIDKLANFDRTAIAKDSDERTIANAIEVKIAEAVSMVTSQILTTASSTISQGLA